MKRTHSLLPNTTLCDWQRVVSPGVGPAPQVYFSLTGFLAFDTIRYIRALVRGAVWDSLRQAQVASADLDTVIAIDPDGDAAINPAPANSTGLADRRDPVPALGAQLLHGIAVAERGVINRVDW
jgi:hypothetical protein